MIYDSVNQSIPRHHASQRYGYRPAARSLRSSVATARTRRPPPLRRRFSAVRPTHGGSAANFESDAPSAHVLGAGRGSHPAVFGHQMNVTPVGVVLPVLHHRQVDRRETGDRSRRGAHRTAVAGTETRQGSPPKTRPRANGCAQPAPKNGAQASSGSGTRPTSRSSHSNPVRRSGRNRIPQDSETLPHAQRKNTTLLICFFNRIMVR